MHLRSLSTRAFKQRIEIVRERLTRWQILRRRLDPRCSESLERLGTEYGGWTIPVNLLDSQSVCYCVGAGEDISFEVELLRRFGCTVWTFDPTPRAVSHYKRIMQNWKQGMQTPINNDPQSCYDLTGIEIDKLCYRDWGVWDENTTVEFFAPADPRHVSYSITNLQRTQVGFAAQCYTIPTIMSKLGHERIDLLKLDIEGAEYAVVASLLNDDVRPTIVCVEFDEGYNHVDNKYVSRIKACISKLGDAGYRLVAVELWDATFVLEAPPVSRQVETTAVASSG